MATNLYIKQNNRSEQLLYEDLVIESVKMYGQDVYYLPRDIVEEDQVFGDDVASRFNSNYTIEMYIENLEGFDGEGDLFTKFGVEIRDQATFVVSRRRWTDSVKRFDNEISGERPREGDLLYIPYSKKIFQIMHVEHEQPFYQLLNLPVYKLRCELFEYNQEDFDTGLDEVQAIEETYGYAYTFQLTAASASQEFEKGDLFTQTNASGEVITGEVASWSQVNQILVLTNVSSDDQNKEEFNTTIQIRHLKTNTLWDITSVTENMNQDPTAQNEYFQSLTDFLDFSESNPFGDPV